MGLSAAVGFYYIYRFNELKDQSNYLIEALFMNIGINYHFRLWHIDYSGCEGIAFSIWKWALNMLRHFVTLVVRKVCDILKVVTLVGGVTFVHPRLRRLWWCDVCPP